VCLRVFERPVAWEGGGDVVWAWAGVSARVCALVAGGGGGDIHAGKRRVYLDEAGVAGGNSGAGEETRAEQRSPCRGNAAGAGPWFLPWGVVE